jgi:ADP-heptose:LPS heptosyltransferase
MPASTTQTLARVGQSAPQSDFFVFQPGGLGDVVLTSQLVAALKRFNPTGRVVLGIDASLEGLPQQFPVAPDEVFTLNMHPFVSQTPDGDLRGALRALCSRLEDRPVRTYIGAAFRPRWLSFFVAAALRPESALFSGPIASVTDADNLRLALNELGLDQPVVSFLDTRDQVPEAERYRSLAHTITGSPSSPFDWSTSSETEARVRAWLTESGVGSQPYLICFPFVSRTMRMKAWPIERFIRVLNDVAASAGLAVIFVGARAEASELRAAAEQLRVRATVCAGVDFAILCGLFANATAFIGNDTGPAHLGQALRAPGVVIFGGGQWPAYAPWGPGATGVLHSLPCFGCDWDCLFDHAFCVHGIPESVVAERLSEMVRRPLDNTRVVDTSSYDESTQDFIRRADRRYRAIVRDYARMGNEQVLIEREAEGRAQLLKDVSAELDMVRAEADRRARALDEMQRELSLVSDEADRRARALDEMQREFSLVSEEARRRVLALEEVTQALSALREHGETCPANADSRGSGAL